MALVVGVVHCLAGEAVGEERFLEAEEAEEAHLIGVEEAEEARLIGVEAVHLMEVMEHSRMASKGRVTEEEEVVFHLSVSREEEEQVDLTQVVEEELLQSLEVEVGEGRLQAE